MLLPRKLINKQASLIELTMDCPIGWRKLADYPSPQAAADFFRMSTYILKHRNAQENRPIAIPYKRKRKAKAPSLSLAFPRRWYCMGSCVGE